MSNYNDLYKQAYKYYTYGRTAYDAYNYLTGPPNKRQRTQEPSEPVAPTSSVREPTSAKKSSSRPININVNNRNNNRNSNYQRQNQHQTTRNYMARYGRRRPIRRRRLRRRMSRRRGGLSKIQRLDLDALDNNSYTPTISATGTMVHLTDFNVGSAGGNRIGNRLILTSFYMKGEIVINASATSTVVRILLVYSNLDAAGTIPAVGDILGDLYTNYTGRPWAMRNQNAYKNYKILYNKSHILNQTRTSKRIVIWKRYPLLQTKYTGATASTAAATGQHYLVMFSDEATNTPTASFQYRLRYHS